MDRPADIRDPHIRSFDAMESYGKDVEDFELTSMCKVVKKYGADSNDEYAFPGISNFKDIGFTDYRK